nr:major capsid family protein [Delftia sp.]
MPIQFKENLVAFAVGRRVNMEEWNTITRTKEGSGTLGFGVPVKPGTGAHTCVQITATTGENVLGITEASQVLPRPGDGYAQYDNVGICESGVIGVLLGDNVTKGQAARWNTAANNWTGAAQSTTVVTIPGAQFEEDGVSGAVGVVRYRRPVPSLSVSGAPKMHQFNDQQALAFVTGQAYQVNQRVYEARHPDWDFGRLIFVDSSAPEWSPGILTYTSDSTGRANWQSGYAKDIPLADVNQDMQTKNFQMAAIGYQWNLEEVNTTMAFPGASLSDRRARCSPGLHEVHVRPDPEGLARKGHGRPDQPQRRGGGERSGGRHGRTTCGWMRLVGQKTPAQIVRDINIALLGVSLATLETEMADTICRWSRR